MDSAIDVSGWYVFVVVIAAGSVCVVVYHGLRIYIRCAEFNIPKLHSNFSVERYTVDLFGCAYQQRICSDSGALRARCDADEARYTIVRPALISHVVTLW